VEAYKKVKLGYIIVHSKA